MARLSTTSIILALLALTLLGTAAGDDPKPKPGAKEKLELSKEEKEILEATNKERAKEKLPALEPNALLFKAARAHSANMAKKEELEHVLDGKKPGDRADAAGYDWADVAENVAASDDETPAGIVKQWMTSDLHRANILSKDFHDVGIGVVKNAKGDVYYTQMFGTPMKR